MTRINVPVRHDAHVFMSRTAAAETFGNARAPVKIHDKVVIDNRIPAEIPLQIQVGQGFIFFINTRQIGCVDSIRQIVADDRLHGEAFKAEIRHMFHVSGKVKIILCIRAPHIILFTVAPGDGFL